MHRIEEEKSGTDNISMLCWELKMKRYILIDRKESSVVSPLENKIPIDVLRYKVVDSSIGWGQVVCFVHDKDVGESMAEMMNNLLLISKLMNW